MTKTSLRNASRTAFRTAWSDAARKTLCAMLNGEGGILEIDLADDEPEARRMLLENVRRSLSTIRPDPVELWSIEFEPTGHGSIAVIRVEAGPKPPYAFDQKGKSARIYVFRENEAKAANAEEIARLAESHRADAEEECAASPELHPTFLEAQNAFIGHGRLWPPTDAPLRTQSGLHFTKLARRLSDQSPERVEIECAEGPCHHLSGSVLRLMGEIVAEVHARTPKDAYPLHAVKTVAALLLVERDLRVDTPARIRVFADRVEFVAPGGLPHGGSVELLLRGLRPARNPRLGDLLSSLDPALSAGFGWPAVQETYRDAAEKPRILSEQGLFMLTLPTIGRDNRAKLSAYAAAALRFLHSNPNASRREIQEAIGVSYVTMQRALVELLESGAVRRVGRSRATRYRAN